MYYKKPDNITPLSDELKNKLISTALDFYHSKKQMFVYLKEYETVNTNSVAFVEEKNILSSFGGTDSGGVGFYEVPESLHNELVDFFAKDKLLGDTPKWWIQIVEGGSYVGPHMDDPIARKDGLLYLLKAGGPNVITRWYEIKKEYNKLEVPFNKGIPYERLDLIEEHRLEENSWHWLNFNKVHSVENQETVRLALWAGHISIKDKLTQ